MSRRRAVAVIAAVAVLAAIGATAFVLSRPQPKTLSWPSLRNATYPTSIGTHSAPLKDGLFEQEAAPGSASKIIVRLADLAAFGDLDGNADIDAAVVLVSSGGGTGTFIELAAVRNDAGTAHPIASVLLGDRVLVREVRIADGRILVRLRERGATDPFTLRTREISRHYALAGDRLTLVDESETDVQAAPAESFVYRPERLDVAPGASRHVDGTLAPGQIAAYVVHARAGDVMQLTLRSEFDNAVLSVAGLTDGVTYVARRDYVVERTLTLPAEQDYGVKVVSLAGYQLPFTLDVAMRAAARPSPTAASSPSAIPLPARTPAPGSPAPGAGVVERALREGSGAASTFARSRPPIWGVAVFVPSRGIVYTENADVQVPTASVVKALVLIVVLEHARQEQRPVSDDELALLWPMITESDNDATSELWERIGRGPAVASYLRSVGVAGFTPDPGTSWGVSFVSARAMATVLGKLQSGDILDVASRALAIRMLDGVVTAQRWGVTAGTDAEGDRVGLKNGWYPGDEGWRVSSAGIVRPSSGAAYSLAIVTDERVSFAEGVETIEGIARSINADMRAVGR